MNKSERQSLALQNAEILRQERMENRRAEMESRGRHPCQMCGRPTIYDLCDDCQLDEEEELYE
jgi:hypothetical protein